MNPIDYLRTFRIGPFAIFDFTISFLGMALLSPLLSGLFKKAGILIPKKNWVILTIPISVVVHVLIGSMTPLTKNFLDPSGHYIVKLVVVGCCIWGVMGIKRIPRS